MYIAKSKEQLAELYLKDTQKNSFLSRSDVVPRMLDLLVCPKCGKPAFRDKGFALYGTVQCVTQGCRYHGPADKFYNVEMHLMDGGG